MKDSLSVTNGISIPNHELEITASRAGGPGGQHVNKSSTRISIRWNIQKTNALTEQQKEQILHNLKSQLTSNGELIVHNGSSRSQEQNKRLALAQLAKKISTALFIPKKRKKTRISKRVKETQLKEKRHRGQIKKMRSNKGYDE